jgi:hypothetical protein
MIISLFMEKTPLSCGRGDGGPAGVHGGRDRRKDGRQPRDEREQREFDQEHPFDRVN